MTNYFNLKKMKTGKALLLVLTLLCVTVAKAQQRYTFRAQDYVSTDNNRAPQSAFSYDASANTLTITASGTMSLLRISLSFSFFLGLFFAICHPPQSIIRFLSA